MSRVAVIGAGISGMSAAYFLSRGHEVFLFEKRSRLGGHTHTVTVDTSAGPLPIDTGFIVHNDRNYPNLQRLFRELHIATQPTDMSFSVLCRRTGLEYSSRGILGFFAQRRNLLRPSHYRLLAEIIRFNREAPRWLDEPDASGVPLGQYLERNRYSSVFSDYYLLPMASAVWSTSLDDILKFPAATLIRFFENHGMLGIYSHPRWKVVRGGSRRYLAPLTAPYRDRILTAARIRSVTRDADSVALYFEDRPPMTFDHVVFACHGDQVLPLLAKPTPAEREVFRNFKTSLNPTVLHTDGSMISTRRRVRASWNYNLGSREGEGATVTYHSNRLQSLPVREDYCVTLNPAVSIDPSRILRKLSYRHPLYTVEAVRSQQRWSEVSGRNRTHYSGAYWLYGFHEDGLNSALRVARSLGVRW